MLRRSVGRLVGCASWGLLCAVLVGCGGGKEPVASGPETKQEPVPVEAEPVEKDPTEKEVGYKSLDVSALGLQSEDWCSPPEFSPAKFVSLDKAKFEQLITDYTVDWMTPLHDSMLKMDEESLFRSVFETVMASYITECDWNQPGDLEFAPPADDALLDEQNRADVRSEMLDILEEAVVVSSGEILRLSVHECEGCSEPIGSEPFFINAKLTEDGVLVMSIELSDGEEWVRTLYITPDAVVVEAQLEPLTEWFEDLNADTRAGDTIVPDISGKMTFAARKDDKGQVSATVGFTPLRFDVQPFQERTVMGETTSPCMGMHISLDGESGLSHASAHAGDFKLTVPGSVNCDEPSCGAKEQEGDWVYQATGVSVIAEQPQSPRTKDLVLQLHTDSAAEASVAGDVFAEGGIGAQGEGGSLGLEVETSALGYLVTFDPPLKLGGAMTISSFSEHMQMELPDWLADEVFDLTFGGDPKASLFIPAREVCQDGVDLPEPARRQVEIQSGLFEAQVGSGSKTAQVGDCAGASLADEASFTLTSDWAEVGFVCE